MINSNRIVAITKTDLLTAVGTVLGLIGTSYDVIASGDVEGNFVVTGTGDVGNLLANQPVKTLDFADGVTAGVVYFVADYDFGGFKVGGVAVETADVKADAATLYKATLGSGSVTVAAISPIV